MHDTEQTADTGTDSDSTRQNKYDAFISYSHAADGLLAPTIERSLQKFARTWNRRRALRVFRDNSGLGVSPGLWPSVSDALHESNYFILLASPDAAQSEWVNKEAQLWLDLDRADRILPVLTAGDWIWDSESNDFDWNLSSSLPPALRGAFPEEPRHLDLRWANEGSADTGINLHNSRFRAAIAELAAPIHGIARDELEGQDLREHRKTTRLRRAAIVGLLVLAVALSLAAVLAVNNAREAREQATVATSRQLAAQAIGNAETTPDLALLQAANAHLLNDNPDTRGALLTTLEANPSLLAYVPPIDGHATAIAGRERGALLAVGSSAGSVLIYDVKKLAEVGRIQVPGGERITSLAISNDASRVAVGSAEGSVSLWDLESLTLLSEFPEESRSMAVSHLAFDPSAEQVAVARDSMDPDSLEEGTIEVWNVEFDVALDQFDRPFAVEQLYFTDPVELVVTAASTIETHDLLTGNVDATTVPTPAQAGPSAHSPNGEIGATSNLDQGDVRTYLPGIDANQSWGATVGEIHLDGGSIDYMEWDSRGNSLAVAQEGAISLWNAEGSQKAVLHGAESAITDMVIGPNAKWIATLGNGKVQVWNPRADSRLGSTSPISRVDVPNVVKRVVDVSFSPDSSVVAWISDPGGRHRTGPYQDTGPSVSVWNPTSGEIKSLKTGTLPVDIGFISGSTLATGGGQDSDEAPAIETWDYTTNELAEPSIECVPSGSSATAANRAYLEAGTSKIEIETCSEDGSLTRELDLVAMLPVDLETDAVASTSSSGTMLAVVHTEGEAVAVAELSEQGDLVPISEWKATAPKGFSGNPQLYLGRDGDSLMLIYSQADPTEATGGRVAATVWNTLDGSFRGSIKPAAMEDIAISPAHNMLAIALSNGNVEIRDFESLNLMTTLDGDGDGAIARLEFSLDGLSLAQTTTGGGLAVWDLDLDRWASQACRIAGRNLHGDELPDLPQDIRDQLSACAESS